MEGQPSGTDDEINLGFSETEAEADVKGTKKKDRKELFQINTHPATVVAANNKRDRRLKQIVMRVVAFCKREHEEGLQVPFRFFKKRASLMTGVSLSTIHRIETIDMRVHSPDPVTSSSFPSSVKTSSATKNKVAKETRSSQKAKKKKRMKKKKAGDDSADGGLAYGAMNAMNTVVATPVVQLGDLGSVNQFNNHHIHFQTLSGATTAQTQVQPAAMLGTQASQGLGGIFHPVTPHPGAEGKPSKKKRKKAKEEIVQVLSTGAVLPDTSTATNINITSSTDALLSASSHITTLQPAALPADSVTTISLHNNAVGGATVAQQQPQRAPCTWSAGALAGPFTMGELRAEPASQHALHMPGATAHHVQVSAQPMAVGAAAIPVGAQLQPIVSVGAAGAQQTFPGHLDTAGWTAATMGPFGNLPTTATLVTQQVVHAYPGNVAAAVAVQPPPPLPNPHQQHHQQQQQQQQQQQLQQQQQQQHVFYQFQ